VPESEALAPLLERARLPQAMEDAAQALAPGPRIRARGRRW